MSLQTKFTVLLSLVALIVAGALGATLLFGRFLENELVRPFRDSAAVLRDLATLRQHMHEQRERLPEAGATRRLVMLETSAWVASGAVRSSVPVASPPFDRVEAVRTAGAARDDAHRLLADESFERRVGVTSVSALRDRVEEAERSIVEWRDGHDQAAALRAADAHRRVAELIDLMEQRVLGDAPGQMAYLDDLRGVYRTLTYAAIAAVGLIALLGVILLRRWVILPIRRLHEATVRIGRGEFEHRVPVASHDELGTLSAEVNRMTGLIKSMQEEAVERERLAATGQMVRRIVHNLRNPLAAIRSLAELSRRRAASDEAVRKDQNEIIAAVDRFNGWLVDLLNVNAPLRIVPARTELRPWLEGIVAAHRPLARMRGVELITEFDAAPLEATFDHRHLEHAVVALVTNAIQASPGDGKVTLGCRRPNGPGGTGFWEIEVRDQGPGIPPDALPRIFRPYFTTKRDGTGIGLAVAQQVVQGHGGEINVQTSPVRGTTFTVRLPVGLECSEQPAEISRSVVFSHTEVNSGEDSGR